ncbi:MAG: hypothetical protein HZT40_22320 [Candidatus Thiothrix singaporensis]|uniref:Uncharacterized protein n=1 Tax=Candidatus Thiothrix singaporensis TaxID=2799669 RepID=A0A7L6AXG9_9GAMM|nr:MAG: hypothetical protein HZT40_22320 [Candidatus Thiothrix singaporensis]
MADKIGFVGSCTADLSRAPEYINGIKHCYYDCSLKFGKEQDAAKWRNASNSILLQDFKDVGEKGWRNSVDYGTQVCIGQDVKMDTLLLHLCLNQLSNPFRLTPIA